MSSFLRIALIFFALVASVFSAFVPQTNNHARRATWGALQSQRSAVSQRDTLVMMPATLERGGPAVLDRPETLEKQQRTEEPVKERKGLGSEAWEVRIYNDGMNTREHVARSLVQITGMSEMTAYQTMMQAHQNGIAVVGRYVYEIAEMYHEALKKNGIICDIVPVDEE